MEVTINSHMSARGFLQNMPLSLVACVAIAACFARAQLRRQHCLVAGAAATLLPTTLVWARTPSFSAILPRQRWVTASSSLAQQLPRLLRVQWPQMADWLLFKPEIIGEASKIIIFLSQERQLRYIAESGASTAAISAAAAARPVAAFLMHFDSQFKCLSSVSEQFSNQNMKHQF